MADRLRLWGEMSKNQHKVLVVGKLPASAMALFEARDDIDAKVVLDVANESLKELMRDASGMTLRGAKISADMIRSAEKLKVISRLGVGYDNVDIPAMNERGAALTSDDGRWFTVTPDRHGTDGFFAAILRRPEPSGT